MKSQSNSKYDPASAMARSLLARVLCGADLAGRVKCCPEQARATNGMYWQVLVSTGYISVFSVQGLVCVQRDNWVFNSWLTVTAL